MKPNVSIITVTFNDAENLQKTIKSVIKQKYQKEFIIIDGNSKDYSKLVIKKYQSNIDKVIIENDKGLYDAMNKAVSIASNDWLIFLNAGDTFYNESVIEEIFSKVHNNLKSYDFIYGDTILLRENKTTKYLKASPITKIIYGMPFCHQSLLIKSTVHKELFYKL